MAQLNFSNVSKCCARAVLTGGKPIVDLTEITFFTPFALVYLGMFLRHINSQGISVGVTPPLNETARDYLARQNFWSRFNFDPSFVKEENLRRLTTDTSFNDIVDIENSDLIGDEIGDELAKVLSNCHSRLPAGKVALIVSELVDNFAQHSERNLAALMVQYYPRPQYLQIGIADCGIGIRASLAMNKKHAAVAYGSHSMAVIAAFTAGVSRKREGGLGFTDILDGVHELGGRLRLATGNEYVIIKDGTARIGDMGYDLSGVQVDLFLPVR